MNERIKELRKKLNLTQQEFASRIDVSRNTVATYELGRSTPNNSAITLICREFGVSEEWLREGVGEMFKPLDRTEDIARLTRQLLDEESDSFKNRFITMLSNLTADEWEILERKARELFADTKKD